MPSIRKEVSQEIKRGSIQKLSRSLCDGSACSQKSADQAMPIVSGSETESLNDFDLKRKSVKRQHCYIETSDSEHETDPACSPATNSSMLIPQNWDSLNSNLQTVLPSDDKYTHMS